MKEEKEAARQVCLTIVCVMVGLGLRHARTGTHSSHSQQAGKEGGARAIRATRAQDAQEER